MRTGPEKRRHGEKGQSIAEFALVLPLVFLFILVVIELALAGTRGVIARHGAMRAARVHAVYQGRYADGELYAMLPPALFRGGFVNEIQAAPDEIDIDAYARPLVRIRAIEPASSIRRGSPSTKALPDGLTDAALNGGDTPSPYCTDDGGYRVCGYPD